MGSRKPKPKNKPKKPASHPTTSTPNVSKLPALLEAKPWPVAEEMLEDAAVFNGQALEKKPGRVWLQIAVRPGLPAFF